ncbi:MAG: ATP-binding protein [Paraperlucidibaca sp.]
MLTNKPSWPQAVLLAMSILSAPAAWSAEAVKQVPAERESALPNAQELTLTHLQAEIADLQALLVGQLPKNASLPALFEIDLNDPQVVAQRIRSLQERLNAEPDAKQATDSAQAAPTTPADNFVLLRRERDRLRLGFLQLPAERRTALIEQDRLKRAQATLLAEQAASAKALAATELARDNALAAATAARNDGERGLATEEARLLAQLSELAALRQQWADANQTQLDQRRELFARYAAVSQRTPLPSAQADELYNSIRSDLKSLREGATLALDKLNNPSQVPALEEQLSLNDARFAVHGERVARIIQLRQRIGQETAQLRERERQERYKDANIKMTGLQTLQAQRVILLAQLSPEKRAEATGFNATGMARVLDEIAHVQLMANWYPLQRTHDAQSLVSLLQDVFTAGKFGIGLLQLLILIALGVWVRRRSRDWISHARHWLSAHVLPKNLRASIDRAAITLTAVARELTLLLSLYLVFDWLYAPAQSIAELAMLRKLAYAYGYYALALALIHRVFLTAISRYRAVNNELNHKILRSLRWVARWALVVSIYLILAQALLGRGALYGIAEDVATFGGLVVAWRLIRAWRSEVTQAYLSYSPTGRLAELVHKSQDHSYGLILAAAAFIFVAARGLWTWLSDLALGFEQTRKALAYLFRRQLERQSRNHAEAIKPSALPDALMAALSEEAADVELSIEHFPKLDDVVKKALALNEGGHGGLIALTGDRGAGKTTWLMALQRHLPNDMACVYYSIEERNYHADSACLVLCRVLGIADTTDPEQIIAQLHAQRPQVVLLDLGQNFMLRTVGGLAGYDIFVHIAQATVGRVLWIIAFASWPFEYLQRIHPNRDVYDQHLALPPWSDQRIGELIDARMELAGFTADYDSLLNNDALTPSPAPLANDEDAERTADRYHRLVWDYADGNPRLALHFFRLSLSWRGDKRVEVHLFPMPPMSALEGFATRTHYVLACLVQHENLTAAEAAASLCFALHECQRALYLLHERGFLTVSDGQRYRVSSHWNRAVLRFLQRKKLLVV